MDSRNNSHRQCKGNIHCNKDQGTDLDRLHSRIQNQNLTEETQQFEIKEEETTIKPNKSYLDCKQEGQKQQHA